MNENVNRKLIFKNTGSAEEGVILEPGQEAKKWAYNARMLMFGPEVSQVQKQSLPVARRGVQFDDQFYLGVKHTFIQRLNGLDQ